MSFVNHKYYLSYETPGNGNITLTSNDKESLKEDYEDLTNANVKVYATNIFNEE